MGATVAAKNRKIRQDSLREMLSKKCTVEQIVDNIKKIEDLDSSLEFNDLQRIKVATDHRIKLLSKYLPDLKSVEMTGEDGKDLIPASITITYV